MRHKFNPTLLTILLITGILSGGCSSTSKLDSDIPTPAGTWEYVIPNTPQGEAYGTLSVAAQSEAYSGEMYIDLFDQTVPMEEVAFTENTFTFKATLDAGGQLMGTTTRMTLSGDTMEGVVEVEGIGELEIMATRKTTGARL